MSDLELCYLPATEAIGRFRARELSPVELMEAVIARAEEVDPTVNALCIRSFDEALEQAKEAERRYGGGGPEPRPLEGLPVAIKDEVPVEGQPCSEGSLLLKDDIADHTAPIAERVLAAGGIAHARTTTPEFSCAGFTHSRLWGVTRNPWNPGFTPGGSSGGSGRRSHRAPPRSQPARTSGDRSASQLRSAAWSGSSRRSAAFRWIHRSTSTSTATTGRWLERSPTACSSRT
jgi:aspartyl-tRNA(Asn)/glutamyl-tRNA(Gln) amidotransferase subunit A